MKTEFELMSWGTVVGSIEISNRAVIVQMEYGNHNGKLKHEDVERFAINLLKVLKSKRLTSAKVKTN